jgi:hypothetical protein
MHAPRSAIENKIDASTIFHRYTTEKSDNSDKQRPGCSQEQPLSLVLYRKLEQCAPHGVHAEDHDGLLSGEPPLTVHSSLQHGTLNSVDTSPCV